MWFVCMGYFNKDKMHGMPAEELDAVMGECGPHIENLYDTNKVFLDVGLESEVKTLERRENEVMVTDGPIVETPDLIGSVFILEADSMEEAITLAALHPTTQV